VFHLFRSFLPLHNPIGFGASDFIELAFAALLVIVVLIRARLAPIAQKLAAKPGWVMLLFAVLPVALRWNPILGYGANRSRRNRTACAGAVGRDPGVQLEPLGHLHGVGPSIGARVRVLPAGVLEGDGAGA
jgi:hypothetical protein